MKKALLGAMLSVLSGVSLAQEGDWTAEQKEVWGREETYWNYVQAHNMEGFLSLWDEAFLGWPSYEKSPVGKEKIGRNPAAFTQRVILSYSFEQKAVQTFGAAATTYLQVRVREKAEGKDSESTRRFTHTWRKKDGQWRIIGGMSCIVKPDGTC
jgi:ketosteroid isomerase-like protein